VNTFANARSVVAARELFTRIAKMLTRPMKFGFTEIGERALNRLLFGFRREWVDRFVNNTIRRTPESKRTFYAVREPVGTLAMSNCEPE
jgi:hypothetical protein